MSLTPNLRKLRYHKKQAKKHQRWTGEKRSHDALFPITDTSFVGGGFLKANLPPSPEIPNPGDEAEYESEAKL